MSKIPDKPTFYMEELEFQVLLFIQICFILKLISKESKKTFNAAKLARNFLQRYALPP